MRPQFSALRVYAGAGMIALTVAAPCSTFTVSNTNNSGPGSLRQALLDANAFPGLDVIQLDVLGEISISGGQLVVNGDVEIIGPGADQLALDAHGTSRLFQIASGHAVLSGLTLRNGRAGVIQSGGGFIVNGDLTLRRCALEGNEVPLNTGFNADGGAVFVNSGRRLYAEQCLFLNNRVGLGTGGAVRGASSSGLEFRNCTFSGNSATQGGAVSCGGTAVLDFCTVADNRADNSGGGIWTPGGVFRPSNSIFARNAAPSGPDWLGAASSQGFNLLGNSVGSSGWLPSDMANVDTHLGPFGYSGGTTQVYSLLEMSPAIDSANPLLFLAVDQRDVLRPQGFGPDRGAFEAEPFNAPPVAHAGPDQVAECQGQFTPVQLDGSLSSDPDEDELQFVWYEAGRPVASGISPLLQLSKGSHVLALTVTDPSGESDSDEVVVRVADTQAPSIDNISVSPSSIWPPNHKMVLASVSYAVRDLGDSQPATWLTVLSSEPDSGLSPDDVPNDIEILSAFNLRLRAERFGNGRVYAVTIHARDADGNEESQTVQIVVPKSMGR